MDIWLGRMKPQVLLRLHEGYSIWTCPPRSLIFSSVKWVGHNDDCSGLVHPFSFHWDLLLGSDRNTAFLRDSGWHAWPLSASVSFSVKGVGMISNIPPKPEPSVSFWSSRRNMKTTGWEPGGFCWVVGFAGVSQQVPGSHSWRDSACYLD